MMLMIIFGDDDEDDEDDEYTTDAVLNWIKATASYACNAEGSMPSDPTMCAGVRGCTPLSASLKPQGYGIRAA